MLQCSLRSALLLSIFEQSVCVCVHVCVCIHTVAATGPDLAVDGSNKFVVEGDNLINAAILHNLVYQLQHLGWRGERQVTCIGSQEEREQTTTVTL